MSRCNICECEESTLLLEKDGLTVLQCGGCGLAYTHPQPQQLDEQYDDSYFDLYRKRRDFRLKRSRGRLLAIERILAPGKLLDVGCSLGYFVEAAAERGWGAQGVEISPHASKYARSLGLNVLTGTLEDANFPEKSFDCVSMWDVLEHVPDPTQHMKNIHHILADDGIVAIDTPDIGHAAFKLKKEDWRHMKPAEHLYYFNHKNLEMLLRKTGFEPVRPNIIGGRKYPGSGRAAALEAIRRALPVRDKVTMFGRKLPVGVDTKA